MLPAVHFNDNSEVMAGEVSKIRTDGGLTPKVMLLEWRLPQVLPQLPFSLGRIPTQGACARNAMVNKSLCSL